MITYYLIFTLTVGSIYAILALSLNLAWGTTGLVNLGLAGFFGIGAYAAALTSAAGWSGPYGIALALAAGACAGAVIAAVTVRLRDDYLAIVTLGFAEMVRLVVLNETALTRGADGISGISTGILDQSGTANFNLVYLLLTVAILGLVFFLLWRLDRGPYGRALRSVREDQILSSFAGKRPTFLKLEAFSVSAAVAALGGALYAYLLTYISPDHIVPQITIYIFLAVMAGGLGRPAGAVVGAFAIIFFLEATRGLAALAPGLSAVQVAAVREIFVGLLLVILINLRPQGLLPERIRKAPAPKT